MLARWAEVCYGAALLTLPWAGVGLLKLSTGRDWGGGLQPAWLFLAMAILLKAADRFREGTGPRCEDVGLPARLRRWWLLGALAILASVLVSVLGLWVAPAAETTGATLGRFVKQLIQLIVMVSFAVWPALWTRGRRRWAWTIRLLLVGGLVQVAYGIVQGWHYYQALGVFAWLDGVCTSNPSILSGSVDLYLGDSFRHVPRLRGTICEPLYLGNFLLFLWPLLLIPLWKRRTRRLVAASFFLLLLWTWSRGAWLAFGGQLLLGGVMILQTGRTSGPGLKTLVSKKIKIWFLGLALLLVVVPLAGWAFGWEGLLFPYRRLAQTFSSQDWSNLTRLYSMQAAWRAFLLSPVCGIGWGQFGWHFPALVDPMGLQSQFTWPVVNNFLLLILCETGLIGMLVWSAWGVGLVRAVRSRWTDLEGLFAQEASSLNSSRILLATPLSAFGVWFQMLTFSRYNLPHIWVAVGLLLASLADGDVQDRAAERSGKGDSLS